METYKERNHIPYAPTEDTKLYPDSDGKPMAVSDFHRRILMRTLQVLDTHFEQRQEVYVSGDILMYYVEGNPRKSVSPDVLVTFGLGKKPRRSYLVWKEGKVPDFRDGVFQRKHLSQRLRAQDGTLRFLGNPRLFLV